MDHKDTVRETNGQLKPVELAFWIHEFDQLHNNPWGPSLIMCWVVVTCPRQEYRDIPLIDENRILDRNL